MKDWYNRQSKELFKAILTLETPNEAKRFFRDLLSEQEIAEFGKRWQVVQMLDKKIPYATIEKSTRMSSTTIARISKWLNSGLNGYKLVLKKLHAHQNSQTSSGKGVR
jgi:TrpR-related protein YerC/YecD